MTGGLQPIVGGLLDWLQGELWRPLVGMVVGLVMVALIGWWLARRIRRQARAALGMAWMLGGVVLLLLFFAAATVDAMAIGAGGSVVEASLLGWIPGLDLALPLDRVPIVGAVVYLLVLTPLYGLIVWGIWWSLVSGAHVGEADRAQSQRWLFALTGRDTSGRLMPGFVRWFKPLIVLLSLVLATSLLQLLLGEHPPHPAAWVTAGLFVAGAYMNLGAAGPAASKPAEPPSPDGLEVEPPAVALLGVGEVVAALTELGHGARDDASLGIVARAGTIVANALDRAHPLTRAYCAAISKAGSPWLFQADMLVRSRKGEPALYVGPHGSGRTSGLSLVAFDVALSRWGTVLVVTPSSGHSAAFAAGLRSVLSRGVTPDVVRVAAGLEELAEERQAGHDAVVFVTTAEELRREVVSRGSLKPAFYRGLMAVLVDDLELFGPEAVTALRLALHELRVVVVEASEGAAVAPVVLATATAVGTELEPWASDIAGERLVVISTQGALLAPCDVVVVDSEGGEAVPGPGTVLAALEGLGFAVEVIDEVHAGVAGVGSFVPMPCWELGGRGAGAADTLSSAGGDPVAGAMAAVPRPGVASEERSGSGAAPARLAKLLLVRRADVALAMERHRPVGSSDSQRLVVAYVLDRGGVSRSVIEEALEAARDLAAVDDKPLRLMPVGRSVPDVVRRHLIATVARPRRLDWLRSVFPGNELDALFTAVGGLERVTSPVTVLEGEPQDLVARQVVTIPNAAELAKMGYWSGSSRVSVRATEDGAELFTLDAELSQVLLPPRAAFVDEGRRWEVVSRSADVIRATRRRSPLVVRPVREVTVEQGAVVVPDTTLTFSGGSPITLGAYRVTVRETVVALERRTPSGDLESREELSAPAVAEYETLGVRITPVPDAPASIAAALTALTTLTEDELAVVPGGPDESHLWIVHRQQGGGGIVPWLLRRLVSSRWYWDVVERSCESSGPSSPHRGATAVSRG